jgi:hypothetical protein
MKKSGSCGKKRLKVKNIRTLSNLGIQLFLLLLFAGDGQSKGHDQPAVSRHVQVGCPGLDFFRQKFFVEYTEKPLKNKIFVQFFKKSFS